MTKELVPIKLSKIMQTRTYTVVIVGTPDKQFPIYTEPSVGKLLQLHLTGVERPRPLTQDLLASVLLGLDARIKQVIIHDLQDTVYYAKLFIEQQIDDQRHIVEIDARPSDCISLALMHNAPLFCTRDVMERAIPIE